MRKKRTVAAVAVTSVLAIAVFAVSASGQSVQSIIGNVFLQSSSPGTAQIGHSNITGTFRAGQVVVNASSVASIPVIGNSTSVQPNGVGGSFSARGVGGIGVRGTSTTNKQGPSIGVYGESRGESSYAVEGNATHLGTGVLGVGDTGVEGHGDLYGGHFQTIVPRSYAVFGEAFAQTGDGSGGYFVARSPNSTGLFAYDIDTSAASYGVFGNCSSPTGYGLYAIGRSGASGTKSFRIDHPADPLNKYLLHYSSEGPEPLNVYSGTTTTGSNSFATVKLPSYFESINRDPRVQLTVDDTSEDFVAVKVVGGVHNGSFRLRTSKPSVKVYWEVKAVRNDAWVRKYGAPVEVAKEGIEKGTYQHPELYAAPADHRWPYAQPTIGVDRSRP